MIPLTSNVMILRNEKENNRGALVALEKPESHNTSTKSSLDMHLTWGKQSAVAWTLGVGVSDPQSVM